MLSSPDAHIIRMCSTCALTASHTSGVTLGTWKRSPGSVVWGLERHKLTQSSVCFDAKTSMVLQSLDGT